MMRDSLDVRVLKWSGVVMALWLAVSFISWPSETRVDDGVLANAKAGAPSAPRS